MAGKSFVQYRLDRLDPRHGQPGGVAGGPVTYPDGAVDEGRAWANVLGAAQDAEDARARVAALSRLPKYCPDDGLDKLGQGAFALERMPGQSNDSYRATLERAFPIYDIAGSAQAVIDAIRAYGIPDVEVLPVWQQPPVTWDEAQLVGAGYTGSVLTKTDVVADWTSAGRSLIYTPYREGWVEYTAVDVTSIAMVGATHQAATTGFAWLDFALFLNAGSLAIYEGGSFVTSAGSYVAGDKLRIGIEGASVVYRKNGTLLYTSGVPIFPFYAGAEIFTPGASVNLTTPPHLPPERWDTSYSEFYVKLGPNFGATGIVPLTLGSWTLGGAGSTLGSTATKDQIASIRRIVLRWKAAHGYPVKVFFDFGGGWTTACAQYPIGRSTLGDTWPALGSAGCILGGYIL